MDAPLENRQRHRAFLQHFVKLLEVELRPQGLLRVGAGAGPGRVADLIAARLTNLRAIALDLALRARAREAGRRDHIISRLRAAPTLGVEAGVDDQAGGAKQKR